MSNSLEISIKPISEAVEPPKYAYPGDAGFDLHSTVKRRLRPSERFIFSCGFSIAIPDGFAGLVLPRSGLAYKFGITVINSPGLIDSGYRGEIKVPLINLDTVEHTIEVGDRIAQMVITPYANCILKSVQNLEETERGYKGFGSSGISK